MEEFEQDELGSQAADNCRKVPCDSIEKNATVYCFAIVQCNLFHCFEMARRWPEAGRRRRKHPDKTLVSLCLVLLCFVSVLKVFNAVTSSSSSSFICCK